MFNWTDNNQDLYHSVASLGCNKLSRSKALQSHVFESMQADTLIFPCAYYKDDDLPTVHDQYHACDDLVITGGTSGIGMHGIDHICLEDLVPHTVRVNNITTGTLQDF